MSEDGPEVQSTVLESIDLANGASILRLPDVDGKPLFFLSQRIAKKGEGQEMLPGPERNDLLQNVARTDMLVKGELNTLQRERLAFAMEDLKLPAMLAVHLALNTDKDLTALPKPDVNAPEPVTLAMIGRPGVGKSFISASLSLKEGYGILNFDTVSGHSSIKYRNYISEQVPAEDISSLSVERTWQLVNEAKEIFKKEPKQQPKTLRFMLDAAVDQVLASPKRAEVYLCDMPGMPGEYNYGTGRTHGKDREYDVVDFFAWESCESSLISTHQLTEYTMTRKLNWARDEVVGQNKRFWRDAWENLAASVKGRPLSANMV